MSTFHSPVAAPQDRRQRGFTLVEILVVVMIIGLMATLVAKNLFGVDDDARLQKVKYDISTIDEAILMYKTRKMSFPEEMQELVTEDENGWSALSLREVPKDPYESEYKLEKNDRGKLIVICFGPDKQPDTEDDITSDNYRTIKLEDILPRK